MDDHKFCFIICVSDELYQEECLTYIRALDIPEGYSTDIITIGQTESVCAAYNAAMNDSDARYKIYLRQEVFLHHRRFLHELLRIFADSEIGMIGMVGTTQLSEDGSIWNSQRTGVFTALEMAPSDGRMFQPEEISEGLREVMAVDGRLIATQVDLPWREDLFSGECFYDIAQSMEFRKAGYRIVVTAQHPEAWYFYDTVLIQPPLNESDRRTFLTEYGHLIYENDYPKKRILYPNMPTVSTWNIPWALTLAGAEVVLIDFKGTPECKDPIEINRVSRSMRELHVDAVMSHNYMAPIAVSSAENDIPYISWVYDSIQIALYDESIKLPTNYIFDFDRIQAEETKERGGAYVRHMPLASNLYAMDSLEITEEDRKKLTCDISFIGSLYSDPAFQLPMEKLSDQTKEEIQQVLAEHIGLWDGQVRFINRFSDQVIEDIAGVLNEIIPERWIIGDRGYIEQGFFSRGVSHTERIEAMRRLGRLKRDVRLYTREEERNIDLPGVSIFGELSYNEELPKSYYLSRINLNLTLPSIRSGVPLRVFDVLAAGGFLLTNYQPEIEELFVIGQDLEVFHTFEEMEEKAKYYLEHEKERLQIALNGHRKVRERFDYKTSVKTMLDMVSDDLEQKGKAGLR